MSRQMTSEQDTHQETDPAASCAPGGADVSARLSAPSEGPGASEGLSFVSFVCKLKKRLFSVDQASSSFLEEP